MPPIASSFPEHVDERTKRELTDRGSAGKFAVKTEAGSLVTLATHV